MDIKARLNLPWWHTKQISCRKQHAAATPTSTISSCQLLSVIWNHCHSLQDTNNIWQKQWCGQVQPLWVYICSFESQFRPKSTFTMQYILMKWVCTV